METEKIEAVARKLWGNDLHKDTMAPVHNIQLEHIFKKTWKNSLKGDLLEIGCGSGVDLASFIDLNIFRSITAIDLGKNVEEISAKYENNQTINVHVGNAMNLEFESSAFDMVYSFGVFHHTSDPLKCFSEAHRVLREGGNLFLYLYSSHEKFFLKKVGVWFETILMKIIKFLPYKIQSSICIILSPLCWAFFSIPAVFVRLIINRNMSKKIPFHWGTHPFSLVPDLKDRLMSPINHRFSFQEIELILQNLHFKSFNIQNGAAGIYIHAEK